MIDFQNLDLNKGLFENAICDTRYQRQNILYKTSKINQIASQNVYISKFSWGSIPPDPLTVFENYVGPSNISELATALHRE